MGLKSSMKMMAPKSIRNLFHLFYAWRGAMKYGHPSEELLVIGVTGTSGKSSTIYFLRQILEYAGYKVGALSTIEFYVAGESKLNDKKMTMLGKTEIQKYLRAMVDAGCDVAIIETTSEGAVQRRHRFINYDIVLLTNLYPEHIESHGSFENYKAWKHAIVKYVCHCELKAVIEGHKRVRIERGEHGHSRFTRGFRKTLVVNGNMEYVNEFLTQHDCRKGVFIRDDQAVWMPKKSIGQLSFALWGERITADNNGLTVTVKDYTLNARLYGKHNISNILAATAVAFGIGVDLETIADAVMKLKPPPGRVEFIPEAEDRGFQVIVDYAFEPVALAGLYEVVELLKPKRVIHVCGSAGGGRDKARRKPIGELVGEKADICIVTDEDPYDEDPVEIIKTVSAGAQGVGKKLGKDLFEVLDRREAIEKAISLAQEGDLVLVTGKGSEQKMCVSNGRMIDWDDRQVVKEAIQCKSK